MLLLIIAFGLLACEQPKTETAPEPAASVPEIPKYSAEVFF